MPLTQHPRQKLWEAGGGAAQVSPAATVNFVYSGTDKSLIPNACPHDRLFRDFLTTVLRGFLGYDANVNIYT